jgi:ribosomal protein S18 acetylase RimI-like enzyme
MNPAIQITSPTSTEELQQILSLQHLNHSSQITIEQAQNQGFVTVRHDLALLDRMNLAIPQVIAKDENKVVGYALVMLEEFRKDIPVLEPMFVLLEGLSWKEKKVSGFDFFVMGQICIAEGYRGQGIFDKLYAGLHTQLADRFELCITEVATRNERSMRAHQRVGFETLMMYEDATDHWAVLVWDWGKKIS